MQGHVPLSQMLKTLQETPASRDRKRHASNPETPSLNDDEPTLHAAKRMRPGVAELIDAIPVRSSQSPERELEPASGATSTSFAGFTPIGPHRHSDLLEHHSAPASFSKPTRPVCEWPFLPGFTTFPPFAVRWEIVRIALHCGINLQDYELDIGPDEWEDQKTLRGKLREQLSLVNVILPPTTDERAWDLALGKGKSSEVAVEFSLRLVKRNGSEGPLHSVKLAPIRVAQSHRLIRRFGADRWLEVIIPSPTQCVPKLSEEVRSLVMDWVVDEQQFLGRSWASIHTNTTSRVVKTQDERELRVYEERIKFFSTHGDDFRPPKQPGLLPTSEEAGTPGFRTRVTRPDLLAWAIGIRDEKNRKQPALKLFSRLQLNFSRTSASVVFDREHIHLEEHAIGGHTDMGDGAGLISLRAARSIADHLRLDDVPSAFQGRLGSAKGMWIVDANMDDQSVDWWIQVYPSQVKWHCDFEDELHRTFEVKDWARPASSASLNKQFIPVLEAQAQDAGMMRQVISNHLEDALKADLELDTGTFEDPAKLLAWIQGLQILSSPQAKTGHTPWVGGLPQTSEDVIQRLVLAGFKPTRSAFLNTYLQDHWKRAAENRREKMKITIPSSTYLFIIPDFWGVLDEGEVSLTFSNMFKVKGKASQILLENMDVLVARAPAHFASDIQRVRAVSQHPLRKLKDVMIFSTKGKRPLADRLSGGDYDGDKAWICWDSNIVRNFENAPDPRSISLGLQREKRTFNDIVESDPVARGSVFLEQRTLRSRRPLSLEDACVAFLKLGFEFNMRKSLLGPCTIYKERLANETSVTEPKVVVLSTLLGELVDQAKQGTLFDDDAWREFRAMHLKNLIGDVPPHSLLPLEVGTSRPEPCISILDHLEQVAHSTINNCLEQFSKRMPRPDDYDSDLMDIAKPLMHASKTCEKTRSLLTYVNSEVNKLYKAWGSWRPADFQSAVIDLHSKWCTIQPTDDFKASYDDVVRDQAANGLDRWSLVKAALTLKSFGSKPRFVWHMAGIQLMHMKAMATGNAQQPPQLVAAAFSGFLKPDNRLIARVISGRVDAEDDEAVDEGSPGSSSYF